jgi:aminoglycoside phosphotransferase (APT) family kinase protein
MRKDSLDIRLVEHMVAPIFPRSSHLSIEQVDEGVSTYVYRIYYAAEKFYLRVLPEINASFAPEVHVHQLLRDKQVKVPEVVYFEHFNEQLQRSILVTTEIKGTPLSHCFVEPTQRAILYEAGRDLAVINSLPVKCFGWISRSRPMVTHLEAEHPTYKVFVYEYLERDLGTLEGQVLKRSEIIAIRRILDRFDTWLDSEHAWLAHGDFDVTHIYQDDGRYSGIIDFGEIRGTDSLYDLGHFRMRDGETLPTLVLPYLVEGYREVAYLPPDYEQRISLSSLLIAINTLARTMSRSPENIHDHQGLKSIRRDIQVLLT